jgi:uncharacterized membrane protein (DUF485 family)
MNLLSAVFNGAVDKGAEQVEALIKEKTGIDIQAQANTLDENDWEKLRVFEAANAAKLAAMLQLDANDVERSRIAQKDRESARHAQQAALASSDKMAQRFIYVYASTITLLTFVFVFYAAFAHDYAASPGSEQVINTVLGFLLGTAFSAVVQYYFGSSIGSKRAADRLQSVVRGREE